MRLLVFSKALYSTWIYYAPDRLLFDAGEGVSTLLGNKCFAIQRVWLTHGHADHTSGLLGLLNIRNSGLGDTSKPLTIYYPEGNWRVGLLIDYLKQAHRRLSYPLEWVPLQAGARVRVFEGRQPRYVEAFPTEHAPGEVSLGYNVVEVRKRLRPEFQGLPQDEILALVRAGRRDEIEETYAKKLFSYGGDSVALDPAHVEETDILCHDATFLTEEEREDYKHATLAEALEVATRARVQQLFLGVHISSRYQRELKAFQEKVQKYPFKFQVVLVPPGKLFRLD